MLTELPIKSISHPTEHNDLKEYEPGGKYFIRKDCKVDSISANIINIFKIMRPVFMKIASLPGVSNHQKEAIRTYIVFMDTI